MPPQNEPPKMPIDGVRNLITIGSGKGGVGKTTVSVNLAIALARLGQKVGLLDADVYGPNVPLMMGIHDTPYAVENRIQPLEQHGVKLMSMGFLNPGDKPLIWRGPMLHSVMQQFMRQVDWGELDFLLIDLPPGTGDVALSLIQTAPITGAIVVSTPSEVALEDGRKAVLMFRQVKVELLGLVENMSYLIVPGTGQKVDIFGEGGGRRTAEAMDIPFLGELPLNPQVRIGGDTGRPIALMGEQEPQAEGFYAIAKQVIARCSAGPLRKAPSFSIED
ncbi:Mrp/NBP35 family ATP-binding protein [Paludibaculum fermentans]|uniref:Iron-sulfur cluster carrier protein n=1 Tax=Paludibaculum fermentans TaxID=1473598 RepID=A0A7S7NKP6_PALFE|nr:Mrp/NBP35 family ATP-binding protein [Paludibaculum fermentans]QOY85320.1 Mrp/NBP35 family ATP-binding protein [Paludibaculum fermentans]